MFWSSRKQGVTLAEGDEDCRGEIGNHLREYNRLNRGDSPDTGARLMQWVLRDEQDGMIGGIAVTMRPFWKKCYIDLLWVDARCRGLGYGAMLLRRVEECAVRHGCPLIQVDTFSFQAPGFYERNGYELFGILEYPEEEYSQYYFKKLVKTGTD